MRHLRDVFRTLALGALFGAVAWVEWDLVTWATRAVMGWTMP